MSNIDNNVFLALVRAGLWGEDACISDFGSVRFSEVMRLVEEQSVIGLVAASLEKILVCKVPHEISLQIAGQALQLEQRNIAMNRFIATLVEKMRNTGIYALLVKCQGVAQCYKRPLWRACRDVDFFLAKLTTRRRKSCYYLWLRT